MPSTEHHLRPMPLNRIMDRRHVYRWPDVAPFELEKMMSVTTIIGGGLPKPALTYWAAKMVAERAVDHAEKIDDWVRNEEYDEAFDFLKRAPNAMRDKKADIGTVVHAALEAYTSGIPQEENLDEALLERNRRYTEKQIRQAHGYYKAGLAFLTEWKPQVLFTECPIFSAEYGFAGTADEVGDIDIPERGIVPAIVDFKTGKEIYNEMGLQLSAYSRGEFIGMEDGSKFPVPPLGIEDGILVRLAPSGRYQAAHFRLTDDLFQLFLACKQVALRDKVLDEARGRDLPRRALVDEPKPRQKTKEAV